MKNILIALFMVLGTVFCKAQDTTKVIIDKDGNYRQIKPIAKLTGKFYYENDSTKLPIYISKNNKLFVIKTSKKTGKSYNKYLN